MTFKKEVQFKLIMTTLTHQTFPTYKNSKKASVSYIAGYVVRMVETQVLCSDCSSSLGSATSMPNTKFLKLKDRGSLYKPTKSFMEICEETKKCFEQLLIATSGNLRHGKELLTQLL